MQIINHKKFIKAALNLDKKFFVMHINYLKAKISLHLSQKAYITLLLAKKITILNKYLDFTDLLFKKSAIELPEHSDINDYIIDLKLSK